MINELKPKHLNCNIFSVYDYDSLTMQELLCQFFTKINECIEVSNESKSFLDWLKHFGVGEEISKIINEMYVNGTLANIINEDIFNDLNMKISSIKSSISNAYNEVLEDNLQQSLIDNKLINPSNKTYTITEPLILTRDNMIVANECTIIADYSKWKGNDFTAIKVIVDDDALNPSYVVEHMKRCISGLKLIGIHNENMISTGIKVYTTKEVNSNETVNYAYIGKINNILIDNFTVGLELKECWNTNIYDINIQNCNKAIVIKGMVVNTNIHDINLMNFKGDNSVGVLVDSDFYYTNGQGRPEGIHFEKCLIFGAHTNVDIYRCLHLNFSNCIIDGANKYAVRIADTTPDNVIFDKCYFYTYDTSNDSTIIKVEGTIDTNNSKIQITNSKLIGNFDGVERTNYGIYFIDQGVARTGCTISGNNITNVKKAMALIVCPVGSFITNNSGWSTDEFIFIQNRGEHTIVDGNKKTNEGYVVKLYAQKGITDETIDIRNNSSVNYVTYKRGTITIPRGSTSVEIKNNFYNSEIGTRCFCTAIPTNSFIPFKVEQNINWSNARITLNSSEDNDITFIYECKTITL